MYTSAAKLGLKALKSIHFQKDEYILLTQDSIPGLEDRILLMDRNCSENLFMGSFLGREQEESPCLQIMQFARLPTAKGRSIRAIWARSTRNCHFKQVEHNYLVWQKGYSLAWITLSEKGFSGQREDRSGPAISGLIGKHLDISREQGHLLPDREKDLTSLLTNLALEQGYDLTSGSTGITSGDIAPQATSRVIERRLPGFELQMTQASLAQTSHGIISRAVAGTANKSLIVNLPGSPAAVETNLTALLPALKHTLDKLRDDPTECA